jgi:hypothetical protein
MKFYIVPPFEEDTFALALIIPHIVRYGTCESCEYSQTDGKMSS